MMTNQKRGQAAMEFLMTYGWAILAAIIVVGVLWFLIGNPSNLAGDRFTVSAPLVAEASSMSGTTLSLEIRNGAGESINVTNINVASADCTDTTPNQNISQGNLYTFTITCGSVSPGDRLNTDITFSYLAGDSTLAQQATGSVSIKVP